MKLAGLRKWRELRGYTQRELAKAVGTSQDTVSKLETGARGCRPSTAQRLAQVLEVDVAELAQPPEVLLEGTMGGTGGFRGSLEVGKSLEEQRDKPPPQTIDVPTISSKVGIPTPEVAVHKKPPTPEEWTRLIREVWNLRQGIADGDISKGVAWDRVNESIALLEGK